MATGGGASSSVPGAAPPPIRGRSRKRRSSVWNFFVSSSVPGSEDGRAMCKKCEEKLRTGARHGTSHLKRHIYNCFRFPADQPLPLLRTRRPPPPRPPPRQGVQVSSVYVADVLDRINELADDFDNTMHFLPEIDDNNDPNTSFEDSEGLVNYYLSEDGNIVFESDTYAE